MSRDEVTREELELAVQSFEQMGGMAKYAQIMEQATSMMRDNFEVTERALRMVQTLHEKQLEGIDQWLSICKFLLPTFVTIASAGFAIKDATFFDNQIACLIGVIGSLATVVLLVILTVLRSSKLRKQEKDLAKLNRSFQQGQDMVNVLKSQAQDERGEMTDDKMRVQLEKALEIIKRRKE